MTVENTTSKQIAQQMGTLTEYPFTFTVLLTDPTEEEALKAIKAKVKTSGGEEIDLAYGSDDTDGYIVKLNSNRNGGTVTVNDKRSAEDYITIYREYEETQEADYQDFNAAPAETYEQCFDKLTMLCQQQQEQIDRSVKVGMTSDIEPEEVAMQVERIYQSIDNVDAVADNESNINIVADDINNVNICASNINAILDAPNQAASAKQSANNAEIWAEGTDEEVQALGGTHSAKTWAGMSEGANVDLSNITDAGKEVIKENSGGSGLEVGDIAFTQGAIDETKGLRRALNGSVVTQNSNTQGFFDWFTTSVTQNPDIATTEAEWQSENTTNGMCGKFVYTAESTTNYYAYTSGETTYFTTSTDDSESVNVYNSEFELQGTGSISSGVLTYNTQTYNRDSESDDTVTNSATLRIPNYPKYFIGNVTSGTVPVVGNGQGLGTIFGKNSYEGGLLTYSNDNYTGTVGVSSNRGNVGDSGASLASTNAGYFIGVTTDAEASGLEANLPAPYKIAGTYFIQIATGQETEVNITNEIELNNPFFFGMYQYFEAEPNNLSWLKSAGQWNSKAVYPDYYNWLLQEKNNPSTLPASEANVDIAGSLINNNGVLSGFSESNYALVPDIPSNIESLEIVFKYTTTDDVTTRQSVYGQNIVNETTPQLTIGNGNGLSQNLLSLGADNWGTGIYTLETPVANTTYTAKTTWDNVSKTHKFFLAVNNGDFVEQGSVSQETVYWVEQLKIGLDINIYPWLGSIDLNGCYININGSRWWSGMSNGVKYSTEDYTDYDYVINTTDETFRLPVKTKTPSGKAVVGNGISLGITNGTQNFAIGLSSSNTVYDDANSYGKPVGSAISTTTNTNKVTLGITTDSEKSGLELSDGDLYLYYYVGETVQNANLIDAGRIAETKANVADIDGRWTTANYIIFSGVSFAGQEKKTYDLSAYLPDDGNIYEVNFEGKVITGSSSGDTAYLAISTSLIINCTIIGTQTTASRTVFASGSCNLPVGADRSVTVRNASAADTATFDLTINAYRKVR